MNSLDHTQNKQAQLGVGDVTWPGFDNSNNVWACQIQNWKSKTEPSVATQTDGFG